jgi:hypothetical protein
MKTAKLWVNHLSMSGDPSQHISYLTNGHQLSADERPRVWTKSIPKACKSSRTSLVSHWRGIYKKFIDERSTQGSSVHHNAKVTARQFVINLPNDISDAQVNKLAKIVLKDFPRHIPVSMVLHRTSNRGKQHLHLQGLFSYRNGGYSSIQEKFRLDITKQMKATVAVELTKQGYHVDHGRPRSINNKERQWLNAQGSVEQRRNPRFMAALSATAKSSRLHAYCKKQASVMRERMTVALSSDTLLDNLNAMDELFTIYPMEADKSVREISARDRPHGLTTQLTVKSLKHQLIKARQWKNIRKPSRSIRF